MDTRTHTQKKRGGWKKRFHVNDIKKNKITIYLSDKTKFESKARKKLYNDKGVVARTNNIYVLNSGAHKYI